MPVSIEHFTAPSANYNWLDQSPGGIFSLLAAKFSGWVADCNANPGNANKQIAILKDHLSAADDTYRGWVVQAGNGDGVNSFIWAFLQETELINDARAGNYYVVNAPDWADDGGNGGYGTFSNIVAISTSIGWYTSASNSDFIIAYSSDPTQEFFALGWYHRNGAISTYSDWWLFSKDQDDRWFWVGTDATTPFGGRQRSPYSLIRLDTIDPSPEASFLVRPRFRTSSSILSGITNSGDKIDAVCYPAHPQIWCADDTELSFGGLLTNGVSSYYGLAYYYLVVEAD